MDAKSSTISRPARTALVGCIEQGRETVAPFRVPNGHLRSPQRSDSMPMRRLVGQLATLCRWIGWQLERRRGRLALLELTDDQLKDIGLSRSQAHGIVPRRFLE
jgi:uncharacterized protein YjiS (DUF1127 family)